MKFDDCKWKKSLMISMVATTLLLPPCLCLGEDDSNQEKVAGKSTNLVTNGGAENGGEGWEFIFITSPNNRSTGDLATGVPASGKSSFHFEKKAPGMIAWAQKNIPAEPNSKYVFSVKAKGSGKLGFGIGAVVIAKDARDEWIGKPLASITIMHHRDDHPEWDKNANGLPDFTFFTQELTTPPNMDHFEIWLSSNGGDKGEAWFDDVTLVKVKRPEVILKTSQEKLSHSPGVPGQDAGNTKVLPPDWDIENAWKQETATQKKICLNGLWKFQPELQFGKQPADKEWAYLRVPGQWLGSWNHFSFKFHGSEKCSWIQDMNNWRVNGPKQEQWEGKDLTRYGVGWYRRNFLAKEGWKGRKVELDVGEVKNSGAVYLNGQKVGEIFYGDSVLDISKYLKYGQENELSIRVIGAYFSEPDLWNVHLGHGSGLTGDVYLQITDPDIRVKNTFAMPSWRKKELNVRMEVDSAKLLDGIYFKAEIVDQDGNVARTHTTSEKINLTKGQNICDIRIPWQDPKCWTPDTPYLYTLKMGLYSAQNELLDEALPIKFGFREFWIEGRDFYLNGNTFRLRPYLRQGNLACDKTSSACKRGIAFHKTMGFNAMEHRGSSYGEMAGSMMYSEDLLNTADTMGLCVLWELGSVIPIGSNFHKSFLSSEKIRNEFEKRHISTIIKKHRNHPSIIMWSPSINTIGNPPEHAPYNLGKEPLPRTGELAEKVKAAQIGDAMIKKYDPTRPLYHHEGRNYGDVATFNDFLNFMPLQEKEEFISEWSQKGVKPLMMIEYGDPWVYNFFRNHTYVPSEPMWTEYQAIYLGSEAYEKEQAGYIENIAKGYNGTVNWKWRLNGKDETAYYEFMKPHIMNVRRSWRTYGISGGMVHWLFMDVGFGGKKAGPDIDIAPEPRVSQQTPGLKVDQWVYQNRDWNYDYPGLSETLPSTGLENPNPVYEYFQAVNHPLMVYIAGSPERFTAKDHSFWSGEKIVKQIAGVWDGLGDKNLTVSWVVVMDAGKTLDSGNVELKLGSGDIKLVPFTITTPEVKEYTAASIKLSVSENGNIIDKPYAKDEFQIEIYPKPDSVKIANKKIGLYNTVGKSREWLEKTGVDFVNVTGLDENNLKGLDVLLVGRQSLEPNRLTELTKSADKGLKIVLFEQTADTLEALGFRTVDVCPRYVFKTWPGSPILKDIPASGLINWRGESTLTDPYPGEKQVVLDGNIGKVWKWGNYGAVASVVMEKPHFGNFTPILECEFDLKYSPLLEWKLGTGSILFCQMDITGRYGKDPTATTLANHLLEYYSTIQKAEPPRSVYYIGKARDVELLSQCAVKYSNLDNLKQLSELNANSLLVLGELDSISLSSNKNAIADFVNRGGTVFCLAKDKKTLESDWLPFQIKVEKKQLSKTSAPKSAANDPLFKGISVADLHYRSIIPVDSIVSTSAGSISDKEGLLVKVPYGRGCCYFWQITSDVFDPNHKLYERNSQWRLNRAFSQLLFNAGAEQDVARLNMNNNVYFKENIAGLWKVRREDNLPEAERKRYALPDYDDSAWADIPFVGIWSCMNRPDVFRELEYKPDVNYVMWYRKKIKIPRSVTGQELLLVLGAIDDEDETYFNGVKIGGINKITHPKTFWQEERMYRIPASLIRFGEENHIAVRVTDHQGGGGGSLKGPEVYIGLVSGARFYTEGYNLQDYPYCYYGW